MSAGDRGPRRSCSWSTSRAGRGASLPSALSTEPGPLRSMEAGALADVLQRVSSRPRLEAVRELAAELDRLDQAGIPGLKLRQLLTLHTLDVRLRRDPTRWARAAEITKGIIRGADWRGVLTGLGYQIEKRRHRGYLDRHEGRPVAVVHPKADTAEFARLDQDGRPPEGVLLNDCQADGAAYGLLASGGRLRLFQIEQTHGPSSARYIDLDAGALQVDDLDFTLDAVPAHYRRLLADRLADVSAETS